MQYLNYRLLKKQLGLLESYLQDKTTADESIIWLKLLFQRTLDGEIFKLVDFYNTQVADLKAQVHELGQNEKEAVLSVINVRPPSPSSASRLCTSPSVVCQWHKFQHRLPRPHHAYTGNH